MEGKEVEPEMENKTIQAEPTNPGETRPRDNHAENDPDNNSDPGEGPSSLILPMARLCEPKPGASHKVMDEDKDSDDEDEDEEEDEDEDEDDAQRPLVVWEQPLDDDCMPGPSPAEPQHNWDFSSDSDSESSATSCTIRELHGSDDEEEGDDLDPAPKQKSIGFKNQDTPAADALVPEDEMTLILPESVELKPFGRVSGIIEKLVIIESVTDIPPVCEDSIIFTSNRHAAGKISEIFGPVAHPFYVLQFSCLEHIKRKNIKIQDMMYFAPSLHHFTGYIFTDSIRDRGSDASWKNDLEPPPEAVDFSDDEKERAAKNKSLEARRKKRTENRSSHNRDVQKGNRPEPRQFALQENSQEERQEGTQGNKQDNRQTPHKDARQTCHQENRLGARERASALRESRQVAHRHQRKGGRQFQRKYNRPDHGQDRRQDQGHFLQQGFQQGYFQQFGGQEYGQLEFGRPEYGQQQFAQEYQEFHQQYYPEPYTAAAAAASGYPQQYQSVAEFPQEGPPDYQYLGVYGGEASPAAHWCPQPREAGRSYYNTLEYHQEFSWDTHHSRSPAAGHFYNTGYSIDLSSRNRPPFNRD